MEFNRVLLDTGASVNILPKLVFDRFKLKDLEPIKLELQLTDGSIRAPYGKSEDVIVIVRNLAFPVDFIVTDVKIIGAICNAPIILGRPFLPTARAIADFDKGRIELKMGQYKLEIPIPNVKMIPDYVCEDINGIDQLLESEREYDQLCFEVMSIELAETEIDLNSLLVAEIGKELEPKPLTENLKYIFLEEGRSKPIIISLSLLEEQKKIVAVISQYQTTIGWTIEDIKGIS